MTRSGWESPLQLDLHTNFHHPVVWGQASEIKVGHWRLLFFFLPFLSAFFPHRHFSSDWNKSCVNERIEMWCYLLSEECREVERTVDVLRTSSSTWWFWGRRRGVLVWYRCRTGNTQRPEIRQKKSSVNGGSRLSCLRTSQHTKHNSFSSEGKSCTLNPTKC